MWQLRHWLQFLQLRTWIHDNLCYLTIKSDTGQHSQVLRCLMVSEPVSKNLVQKKFSEPVLKKFGTEKSLGIVLKKKNCTKKVSEPVSNIFSSKYWCWFSGLVSESMSQWVSNNFTYWAVCGQLIWHLYDISAKKRGWLGITSVTLWLAGRQHLKYDQIWCKLWFMQATFLLHWGSHISYTYIHKKASHLYVIGRGSKVLLHIMTIKTEKGDFIKIIWKSALWSNGRSRVDPCFVNMFNSPKHSFLVPFLQGLKESFLRIE